MNELTMAFYAIVNSGYFELLWISWIKWCKTCIQFEVSMEKEVKVHLVETFSEMLKKVFNQKEFTLGT